jgi:6-phosphogluconate dehydrogenase
MYIGDGGAGNFVKMVHNGIEYGDMQLISGLGGGMRKEGVQELRSGWLVVAVVATVGCVAAG